MKTISHPVFIVAFTLYSVYYLLKQTDIVLPLFISSYLADLLSIFIVNTVALRLIRKVKKEPNYELSIAMVFSSVILFSLFFEFILPRYNPVHISDPWDIVCYIISGIAYLLWRKSKKLPELT